MSACTKTNNNTKTKLVIDILIFFGFLVAMDPHSTGVALHEWLTVASMAAIITHLLLNWDWIVRLTKRFFTMPALRPRINYVLNLLLFIDVVLIMYTGVMISESFVPFFGLSLPMDFSMRRLHDMTANIFVLLLGLHTALHWGWIVNAFRRYVFGPLGRLFGSKRASRGNLVEEQEA
ncbi:MAG: DUF4405 domain-containing protein [Chloroflexota bacterium]